MAEYSFMQFRPLRQHPECTTCIKHKMLIQSLGHHIRARTAQQAEFHQHLHNQYADRMSCWTLRGLSRTVGSDQLTLMVDGMDQSKFMWPRGACVKTKEMAAWSRPRCHVIGAWAHGHGIFFGLTRPDLPKDSTTHIELVAYILTRLKNDMGVTLEDTRLSLQCDNTVRECKNNHMLAFLSTLVAKGELAYTVRHLCLLCVSCLTRGLVSVRCWVHLRSREGGINLLPSIRA